MKWISRAASVPSFTPVFSPTAAARTMSGGPCSEHNSAYRGCSAKVSCSASAGAAEMSLPIRER